MTASPRLDLDDVILAYLKSIDGGEPRDPAGWVARFPQFADELGAFFAWESSLQAAGALPTPFPIDTVELADDEADSADKSLTTDRFELGAELGHGGIGMVRRAHDPVLNRQLAVKLLRGRHRHHPHVAARFLAEARIAAGLEHPGIPPVHDVGKASDGRPFIAMKLIEGRTLAELLHERPAPDHDLPRFLKIFEQVAQTVAYAHSKGVIHRDLKPHNIMTGAFGEVQVMDWGLAKFVKAAAGAPASADQPVADDALDGSMAPDDSATRPGAIIGTPAYMAPEQARGEIAVLDERADVFGLGAILCQILTGRPPFTKTAALEQARHGDLGEAFARLGQCGCDAELRALAKGCLAPVPTDRPASGQEVAAALTSYLSSVQERLRQVELAAAKAAEVRKRRRMLTVLLVLAVIGSVAAAFGLRAERDAARKSEQYARSADKERLQELYRAYLGEIRASRRLGSQGQRELGLKAIRSILTAFTDVPFSDAQKAELRDEAIACLALPDFREVLRVPAGLHGQITFTRTASHGYLASWDDVLGQVVIRRLSDFQPIKRLPGDKSGPELLVAYYFSPCGRWFAETLSAIYDASKHRLRVWDWQAERLVFDHALGKDPRRVAFHPHAPKMVVSGGDHVLHRYDIESGRLESTSASQPRDELIAFDPSGKMLAVAGSTKSVEMIDALTWQTLQAIPGVEHPAALAWNPVEPQLLIGTHAGRLYRWDYARRVGHFLSGVEPSGIHNIFFTPDGSLLAATTGADIATRYPEGDQLLTRIPGTCLGFFDDGRKLATMSDGDLICYQADVAPAYRSLRVLATDAVFSPDDRLLCLSGTYGVKVHDAHKLAQIGDLGLDEAGPVGFDPLRKELVTFGLFTYPWRWPIETAKPGSGSYRIGPAQPLGMAVRTDFFSRVPLPQYRGRHVAWSEDGSRLAIADYRHGQVLLAERDLSSERLLSAPRLISALPNAAHVALSPDGRWLAAGAAIYGRGAVWRIQDKQKMLDSAEDVRAVQFSPDGRWLAMSTPDKVLLYKVTDDFALARIVERAQPIMTHPTAVAFLSGGKLLAMAGSASQIRFIELETGRLWAVLTHHEAAAASCLSLSPDGTRLAVTRLGLEVGIWDLARLRDGLAKLGLDTAGLPARAAHAAAAPPTLRLEVQRGQLPPATQWADYWKTMAQFEDLQEHSMPGAIDRASRALELVHDPRRRAELLAMRGHYHQRNQNPGGAHADWREAVALAPDLENAVLPLCRLFLLGPAGLRDPERAVTLLAPAFVDNRADAKESALYAYAQVRLGKYQEGLALVKQLPDDAEQPLPRYFEALALQRLARPAAAEAAFKDATAWHEKRRHAASATSRDEWERIRAELAQLFKEAAKGKEKANANADRQD